jgi:hypothetical protein
MKCDIEIDNAVFRVKSNATRETLFQGDVVQSGYADRWAKTLPFSGSLKIP